MQPRTVTLRVLTPDEWPVFREIRLEALRDAPAAFGSTLADWQGERDTERRWRQRLTDVPFNAVAYVDGILAGVVSATQPNADGTELISMWVAPTERGTGVADALVNAVVGFARKLRVATISLDVMESNERARAFYTRQEFIDRGRSDNGSEQRPERRMVRLV